jgi:hypothetical protein
MKRRSKRPRAAQMRAKLAPRKASRAKPLRSKLSTSKRSPAKSSREKVRAHRARMRAKGLRLVQMWLPDTSTPEFKAQAHRDSIAIANSPTEKEDQAFVDSISWWNSEEAATFERAEDAQRSRRNKEGSD